LPMTSNMDSAVTLAWTSNPKNNLFFDSWNTYLYIKKSLKCRVIFRCLWRRI
jgi:hypothetical protein